MFEIGADVVLTHPVKYQIFRCGYLVTLEVGCPVQVIAWPKSPKSEWYTIGKFVPCYNGTHGHWIEQHCHSLAFELAQAPTPPNELARLS